MNVLDDLTYDQKYWITATGEWIKIKNMDKMHIFYTFKKLHRENRIIPDLIRERYNKLKETNPEIFL